MHLASRLRRSTCVNHDCNFAFLGLYLCKPEHRGHGHGIDIWRAGIAHAGARTIGLDGVLDQQANYARSGFQSYCRIIRYAGRITPVAGIARIRPASTGDLKTLIAHDAKACGMNRTEFAAQWFTAAPTRQTMVVMVVHKCVRILNYLCYP